MERERDAVQIVGQLLGGIRESLGSGHRSAFWHRPVMPPVSASQLCDRPTTVFSWPRPHPILGQRSTVRVEFVNPFLQAATEVLETELGAEPARGAVSLRMSDSTSQQVTALVRVYGAIA